MWEDIDASQEAAQDLEWIANGLRKNSLVWTIDGSYDRKRAPDLSAVGWIIFCKATGKRLTGTFWEKSPSATSFRAKMLGLTCLHILASGITEYYRIDSWAATISCDNKKALELSSHHQHRIRPSAKQVCGHQKNIQINKTIVLRRLSVCAHLRAHGPVLTLGTTEPDAAAKLRM